MRCKYFSYLGGHNPVIAELGRCESFSGRAGALANIDSSVVYSSLVTTKLEDTEEGGQIKKEDVALGNEGTPRNCTNASLMGDTE